MRSPFAGAGLKNRSLPLSHPCESAAGLSYDGAAGRSGLTVTVGREAGMSEQGGNRRPGAFDARGQELTALGSELGVGSEAPDALLAGKGFVPQPVRISDYRGSVLILSCVPSLDTGTCDRETRHWEEERRALGGD